MTNPLNDSDCSTLYTNSSNSEPEKEKKEDEILSYKC